jgi:quercetin dioxygenase-like cupin family protein
MRVIDLTSVGVEPIRLFETVGASSRLLADGDGQSHVHWLEFEPGGQIGEHPTGFGQLFIVLEGAGWVAGSDGRRIGVGEGQAAYFERGEMHSKGTECGMKVLMVQVTDLALLPAALEEAIDDAQPSNAADRQQPASAPVAGG